MNRHRDNAVKLLQHYFAVAMGMLSATGLEEDHRIEIAEIVDEILLAVKEQRR